MTGPALPTLKALFARSKNLCAFPGCTVPLAEDSGTVTGEVCHIRAANSKGPRYDASQTDQTRHAAANLVLMCGRHHKIIDTETTEFSVARLESIKHAHEVKGIAEISPSIARIAQQLLINLGGVTIVGNSGNVAFQSPGAIQAQTVNIRNTKSKGPSIQPPLGSIGAAREKVAYCQHLIDRYQEYQKADGTGKTAFKYMAIHQALKREFRTQWKLLGEERFEDVVAFLQRRIDATIIGKLNRSRGRPNYSSFDRWGG